MKQQAEFALVYEFMWEEPDIDAEYCERLVLGREKFIPVIKTGIAPEVENPSENVSLPESLPMVAYPSSIFLGEALQRVLANRSNQSLKLIRVAETGLSLALVEFVRRGLGVGWLPSLIAKADLETGVFTPLDHVLPAFELNVVVARMKRDLPRKAEEFWTTMKNAQELDLG